MLQTMNRPADLRTLKGKLAAAYDYVLAHQDSDNAAKIKQLAGKLAQQEFAIAFCGHFSAGKSTIINRLVGENLLPASPIPTSANLVKVKAGEAYAKVFFKNEKPRMYLAPYDYELVKQYCKDGDQIQEIELSQADCQLPPQVVVMDTPGIDSADDAHRIATESAIHLADLIFYVMDYNHVQSELNFMFTKELTEAGKEVCLVINQVDKHSEQELSFADFQASVVNSFASWGVKAMHIFYTSLKSDEHAHNQFPALQAFLAERLQAKDSLLLQSVFHSLQKIVGDHLTAARKKGEDKLQSAREVLGELSTAEQEELQANYDKLLAEKNLLGEGLEKAESQFDLEVSKIMQNAYLMPFETRALAEAYLEACQAGFKVGFLFTKQKTEAERENRLELFYQGVLEKIKSQLEWHLREFLGRFLKERRLEDKELLARAQQFTAHLAKEALVGAVKPGARLSGESVINYTESVANEIKLAVKRNLASLEVDILEALQERTAALQVRLAQKSAGLERYIAALEQLKKQEAAAKLAQAEADKLLSQAKEITEEAFCLLAQNEEEFDVVSPQTGQVELVKKAPPCVQTRPKVNEKKAAAVEATDRMKQTASALQQTAHLVHDLPGFAKLARELEEKAARLEHKGFTVALFGAFSAGKSSFANALLGEKVLPVSPNPTTAAINQIKPVNELYPHGTVRVKVKDASALLDDVNQALRLFEVQAATLAEAREKAAALGQGASVGAAEKTSYAFLQAFARGYAAFGEQLGAVLETTMAEFGDYVAVEEKSCFVEWIDLYYDCPLTRKGITLVDTPGADSINARHTGVAFEFIKNSDAILFVTYYNHAFSKADREFLIQLGRVKDAFQLDKMFFIINAIDLADNEEEKETVMAYVQEQLVKYGVRNPHLYALSSLHALKEKQAKTAVAPSGMPVFEEAFYHFIANDLANLAVAASENELRRVEQRVSALIASAREDVSVKEQKRAKLESEQGEVASFLAQQTVQTLCNSLQQEMEELLYYAKQRVFLRFNDFFKEAFNPAVLRDDGRDLKKALRQSLGELLEQVGFDLAQELRATTVRLERFAQKQAAEYQQSLAERLGEINADVSFAAFELENREHLEFAAAFQDAPLDKFSKAMACFKNPKAFFEQGESKAMGEALYELLSVLADEYLQREKIRMQTSYDAVLEEEFTRLIGQMTEQAAEFYLSLLSALDGGVPVETLLDIQQRLPQE
ncbi:MAG: Dynamin family protein [Negativicutes bacterium]|nr:Dynamin family protein [Negativicutes bacterium]